MERLPEPPTPATRLELLALEVAMTPPTWDWSRSPSAWLRDHLRREIARRLAAPDSHSSLRVVVTCSSCDAHYEVSQRRASESTLCHDCRNPNAAMPDAKTYRWVAKIPDERLDELFAAVAALA